MISLSELKERKIVQWALAYLAGAWALLQVVALLSEAYAWPASVMRVLPVLVAVGFVAVLVLAFYHGERGAKSVSTPEMVMMTSLLVLAGAAVGWVRISSGAAAPEPTPALASAFAASVAEQGSIAVLPFADLSPEKDQEYFSDGLSEELLNVLSQLPELRVASRTSAFSFKGKDVAIDSIARALKVRHLIEGSVRKDGDRVRITAQLIDASTGYHLWSETYERDLKEIFAISG